MLSDVQTVPVSQGRLWAGRIMSGLPALFLLFGGMEVRIRIRSKTLFD